jgi:Glycosyl hydrolase catalytic core
MFRLTKRALAFLFLLLFFAVSPNLIRVNAQSTSSQSGVINGVLAHEMTSQEAQTLSKSNITWVSCDVTFDRSDSSNWYQIYNLAKQNHLSLLGILDQHLMNYSQTFQLNNWSNAVNQAINEFGDVVKTWEVWNEPNIPGNCLGCFDGSAQQYVSLMQTAYADIKAVAPSDTVLGLGGVPLFTGAEPTISNTYAQQAYVWTQSVVQLGGMQYCDAIAVHAYPYGAYSQISQFAFQYLLQNYQQLCVGKPVWVTEVGQESFSTNWTATKALQSDFLTQSYSLFEGLGVRAYFWYELCDNYTVRPGSNFGLLDNSGNPKDAFYAFTNLTSPNSAAPNSSPTPAPSTTLTLSQSPYPTTNPSPTPIVPELSWIVILPLIVTALFIALKLRHRRPPIEKSLS